jgi:phosphate transport system permease protein
MAGDLIPWSDPASPGDDVTREDDAPRMIVAPVAAGDKVFRGVLRGAGIAVLLITVLILAFLLARSLSALKDVGLAFFSTRSWFIGTNQFGIASLLPNTVIIAVIALLIAIPAAIATALFISEYAPHALRRPLIALIDLMAAIPSIILALWGLQFFEGRIIGFDSWLARHFGFIPFLKVQLNGSSLPSNFTSAPLIAGMIVSLLVIPIIASLSRQVFSQAPQAEREGAYALGATRWGMIRTVVLPFGRAGVIGATMLGLGRALGETIVVLFIITPVFTTNWHVTASGGNSIAAWVAGQFREAGTKGVSALMAAGLVLFAIALIVNVLGSIVINRSRSGAATAAD